MSSYCVWILKIEIVENVLTFEQLSFIKLVIESYFYENLAAKQQKQIRFQATWTKWILIDADLSFELFQRYFINLIRRLGIIQNVNKFLGKMECLNNNPAIGSSRNKSLYSTSGFVLPCSVHEFKKSKGIFRMMFRNEQLWYLFKDDHKVRVSVSWTNEDNKQKFLDIRGRVPFQMYSPLLY